MNDPDKLTQKEIDARREAALKKLLATPPKPHKPKPPRAEKPKRVATPKKPKAD